MRITYKKISDIQDLQKLVSILDTVFEKKSSPTLEQLQTIVADDSIINIGAFIDNTLVGGLSAHELTLITGVKEFYLYDIGVLPEYQKQGIGTGLITLLKEEAKAKGITTICVEAEADDDGAVSFYRSLKEEEIGVRHFNISV